MSPYLVSSIVVSLCTCTILAAHIDIYRYTNPHSIQSAISPSFCLPSSPYFLHPLLAFLSVSQQVPVRAVSPRGMPVPAPMQTLSANSQSYTGALPALHQIGTWCTLHFVDTSTQSTAMLCSLYVLFLLLRSSHMLDLCLNILHTIHL
jgi:hypothetical protein